MKFSTDKKSSLFIYTNDMIKGSDDKMENGLKKELEATKSALRLQTIRCRQLVAAFTRKLQEKELELRASKDLKDQQLSRLLRALLILESRLKKEQKQIRQQLQEKDTLIEKQEREILKLKTLKLSRKWSESADSTAGSNKWGLLDGEQTAAKTTTGEERLDNLCKGLLNTVPVFKEETADEVEAKNEYNCKTEGNTFRDNPVLESVNQILLRDEEELLKNVQPVSINLNEKGIFANEGGSSEWYETNSNAVLEEQTDSGAWCINIEEKEVAEMKTKKDGSTQPEKASPIKSQHLEEKACLEMSKKNLTVVDLEEIDSANVERANSPAKSTASYEEIVPVSTNKNYKPVFSLQKPPALPPKPARLLKPYQILQQKNQNLREQQTNAGCPPSQPADQSPPRQSHVPGKAPQTAPKPPSLFNQTVTNPRHRLPEPKPEAKEARPKPPDANSKPKKIQMNGHSAGPLDQVVDTGIPRQFAKQKKKEELVGNCAAIKIGSSVSSLITGLSRETIVTELGGGDAPAALDDSHVSQLVRQFEVLGKLSMERAAEEEANDLQKNFEEFKLEESYVDSVIEGDERGRLEGDGAENRNMVNYYATLTIMPPPPLPKEGPPGAELEYKMYETFLENTGLSQKSILTPSRMLSNHRSCLKPKDVKHRSRVKAAAAIEKCNVNTINGGSTVKYWTEPFL